MQTTIEAQELCQAILSHVRAERADAFVPEADRPDTRFGRFFEDGTPRISPNQVNQIRMCPARWRHAYLEGRPDQGSYQAVVGSIGHAALEAALPTLDDPVGPRELEEATRVAAQVHLSDPATLGATSNGHQADPFALADRVAGAVRATWDWVTGLDAELVAVEERTEGYYDVPDPGRDRVARVGSLSFIDARIRIDGQDRIIDWKFPGRKPWMQNGEVDVRDSYQLAMQMYADAYRQVGVDAEEAWIVYAPLEGRPKAIVAKQAVSEESIAQSRRQVEAAVQKVLIGDLPPDPVTPGALCSRTWCSHYEVCPAVG